MAFDNEYYKFEKNDDGSYKVFDKRHLTWGSELESLFADEVLFPEFGGLLVKYKGQYTLYAHSHEDICAGKVRPIFGLIKFLDGILEYFYFGNVFLYQTVDGWFFIFVPDAFWYIRKPTVLKKRVEGITKLCDADTQILDCQVIPLHDRFLGLKTGYVVKTTNGSFLLYQDNFCVYDVATTHFIKMNRYSIVPGYGNLAKIYPNKGRNFFLASPDHYMSYNEHYKDESYQKITYLGEGYLLAQKGKKSKLLFRDCFSKRIDTVVDWGVQSFTKLNSVKEDNSLYSYVHTEWRVDNGESSQIIVHRYNSDWVIFPNLPEGQKL